MIYSTGSTRALCWAVSTSSQSTKDQLTLREKQSQSSAAADEASRSFSTTKSTFKSVENYTPHHTYDTPHTTPNISHHTTPHKTYHTTYQFVLDKIPGGCGLVWYCVTLHCQSGHGEVWWWSDWTATNCSPSCWLSELTELTDLTARCVTQCKPHAGINTENWISPHCTHRYI